MTKKKMWSWLGIGLVYAIAVGVVLPWLISAKSTVAFVLGGLLLILMIAIPLINFLDKNANS